jgi:hypothetical protein
VLGLALDVGDVVVGVGAGVVVVGVVLGVVVGAVGVGDALGIWSGAHDSSAAAEAVLAVAVPAVAARPTPEPAASRTVPAISVTVAGRACAKRMKRPYPVMLVTAAERLVQLECGVTRLLAAIRHPLDIKRHAKRYTSSTRSTRSTGTDSLSAELVGRMMNVLMRDVVHCILFVTFRVRGVLFPGL